MSTNNTMAIIERLTGRDNYTTWRFAMQTFLELEDLWHCVTREPGVEIDQKNDTKAKAKIIFSVDPVNYVHIQESKTTKEVWDNLAKRRHVVTTYTSSWSVSRAHNDNIRYQNSEDYVNKIMSTAHKLRNIGFIVNDEWLGTLLLARLPDMYQPMIMALESSGLVITADAIKTKLLQDVKTQE